LGEFPDKQHFIAALDFLDGQNRLRTTGAPRKPNGYEWAVTSPRWPGGKKFKAIAIQWRPKKR
jgi:hypothetical protein